MVRVEGDAVAQLQATFAENWLESCGEVLTGPEYFPKPQTEGEGAILVVNSTPSVGGATRSRILFQVLLASAGKSIKALEERGLISPGKGRDLSHGSKWKEWLSMCATNPECNTLAILGGVLEKFMDIEPNQEFVEKWKVDRERVARTLERTAFDATPVVESSRAGSRSLHKGCRWLSPITRLFKPPRRVDRRKRAGS